MVTKEETPKEFFGLAERVLWIAEKIPSLNFTLMKNIP
jgi:hypothetical protein